jgi:hypothetical protein
MLDWLVADQPRYAEESCATVMVVDLLLRSLEAHTNERAPGLPGHGVNDLVLRKVCINQSVNACGGCSAEVMPHTD